MLSLLCVAVVGVFLGQVAHSAFGSAVRLQVALEAILKKRLRLEVRRNLLLVPVKCLLAVHTDDRRFDATVHRGSNLRPTNHQPTNQPTIHAISFTDATGNQREPPTVLHSRTHTHTHARARTHTHTPVAVP